MILVGTFNEDEIANGADKKAVAEAKEKHGLQYTETKLVKKAGKIVGLKIWVCDADSFTLND